MGRKESNQTNKLIGLVCWRSFFDSLCVSTPKQVLLQTVKTQMKYTIKAKNIFIPKKKCFEKYNLTPLNMHNGLSQVYCIKLEGRIH